MFSHGAEPMLSEAVAVRLIENSKRERFDEELVTTHCLRNGDAGGAGTALLCRSPAPFPRPTRTRHKHHGRIEDRELWCHPTARKTMGLAGAA
jgi:hypothetical protein